MNPAPVSSFMFFAAVSARLAARSARARRRAARPRLHAAQRQAENLWESEGGSPMRK
jgi:hypothetical protein